MGTRILLITLVLVKIIMWHPISIAAETTSTQDFALTDENVLLTGRFVRGDDDKIRFSWPGSQIAFRFNGTHAGLNIHSDETIRFQLQVDGVVSTLWVEKGESYYSLAHGLNADAFAGDQAGHHSVVLTRETESLDVVTTLGPRLIINGDILNPPTPKERKLLVFGDSITAGYGVEGENEYCGYDHSTSTALGGYAALTAQKLDAELHIIAWSGIGVWRSYGEAEPSKPTMSLRYRRTLANQSQPIWHEGDYRPSAILINLGTNDFWDGSGEGYFDAMEKFIVSLQQDYAATPIYLLASPMLQGQVRVDQVNVLKGFVREGIKFVDIGKVAPQDGLGCNYHPNNLTQARLAERLTEYLKGELAW